MSNTVFADTKLAALKAEMAKHYGRCSKHHLWHDLTQECFYCVVEKAAA